jgi:hypothetical protein
MSVTIPTVISVKLKLNYFAIFFSLNNHLQIVKDTQNHRLNMELDLQSLFGLLCSAVLFSLDPAPPPAFGRY